MKRIVFYIYYVISVGITLAGDAGDFIKNYPEPAKALLEGVNWELPTMKEHKASDEVTKCNFLVDYFLNSPSFAEERSKPVDIKRNAQPLLDALNNSELKPNGMIDFSKQPNYNSDITRFGFLEFILKAAHGTGEVKYHNMFKKVLHEFTLGHPVNSYIEEQREMTRCWISLNAAIRMNVLTRILISYCNYPNMDKEKFLLIIGLLQQHGEHIYLYGAEGAGNWTTTESELLMKLTLHFPEFKNHKIWQEKAKDRFLSHFHDMYLPDGAQCELTPGYGYIAFKSAMKFYSLMKKAGMDIPDYYRGSLEKQILYYAQLTNPDGNLSSMGDGDGKMSLVDWKGLEFAKELRVEEAIFLLSNGKEGTAPKEAGYLAEYGGYAISRNKLGKENTQWSLFDFGPNGTGHVHHDNLHLSVYNKRRLLVDPGRLDYMPNNKWMTGYFKTVRGHNTVGIGGCDQYFPHWRVGNENWDMNEYYYSIAREPISTENYEISKEYDFFRGRSTNGYMKPNVTGYGYGPRLLGKNCHERGVYYKRDKYWAVVDRVFTDKKQSVEIFWHFNPEVQKIEMREDGTIVTLDKNKGNLLLIPVFGNQHLKGKLFYGEEEPIQGWYAPKYGYKVPSWAAEYYGEAESLGWFGWIIVPFDGDNIPEVKNYFIADISNNRFRIEVIINGKMDRFEMQLGDTPDFEEDKYYKGLLPAYVLKR